MNQKQTVLVAGATGNVGGAAAAALARQGAHVVLLGRDMEALQARADSISATEAKDGADDVAIETLTLDLSDMELVRQAAAEALDRFPTIDGLVLSAVTLIQDGPNVLPSGHELMFATNVMGPFLFTNLLLERLQQSGGLVVGVVAPFYEEIDWDDLESLHKHKTGTAYNRTKTMNRMIAAELARRHGGSISSVAFNSPFVIDKTDPRLKERWPSGFMGVFWQAMTKLFAKPPSAAGEPLAELMLRSPDRGALNGAMFKARKRTKPDKAMNDELQCQRLWDELAGLTGLAKK
jgi:NAD(P)-dependent dehydrogenase (short-subunit alcohol dehydrogenase family)